MMKIKKILLASALVLSTCGVMAQTQVIAHAAIGKQTVRHKTALPLFLKPILSAATVPNSMCGSRQMISLW